MEEKAKEQNQATRKTQRKAVWLVILFMMKLRPI